MGTRSKARRHKGSHRQRRDYQPTEGQASWTEFQQTQAECRRDNCMSLEANETREFWERSSVAQPAFVYFITDGTGPVKIGYARNPVTRALELQCGNPRLLVVRHLILGTPGTERFLHKHWAKGVFDLTHVRGEWFGNGAEDAIRALAQEAARQQKQAYDDGSSLEYIRDVVVRDVFAGVPA